MENIFEYIIIFAIAFYLGKKWATMMFLYNLSENPEKVIDTLKKIKSINDAEELAKDTSAPINAVLVNVEESHNAFYLYSVLDNQFISQGNTIEDALKKASERFPDKIFWLPNAEKNSQTA